LLAVPVHAISWPVAAVYGPPASAVREVAKPQTSVTVVEGVAPLGWRTLAQAQQSAPKAETSP
jgi:hypothetical protein